MSLSSILSSYGFLSGKASSTGTTDASVIAAKIAAAKAANTTTTASTTTGTVSGSGVTISAAAKAAAAAKADNAKDFTVLSKEVRATLDAQYAAGTAKGSPALGGMSGRALAAIALNTTGAFSSAESAAAKQTLRAQDRKEFATAMASGSGMAGLTTYSKQVAAEQDGMSSEERAARGWTSSFLASNAMFVSKASASTLFDQIK